MLRYLGAGQRAFGDYPVGVHCRENWEFFAVVRGRCGALQQDVASPVLCNRRLWVFPPDSAHGWASQPGETCQVVVSHFGAVPPLLDKLVRTRGSLERDLSANDARAIQQLATSLQPHYDRPTEKSLLVFEHALLTLALLALADQPVADAETATGLALRKVEAALTWYAEHLTEQPKYDAVARAIHVSERQLRRLFQQVRQETAHHAFTRVRLNRALELLSQTNLKLEEIAARSGFSSAADFCRVFKASRKVSPDAWRKHQLPAYRIQSRSTRK